MRGIINIILVSIGILLTLEPLALVSLSGYTEFSLTNDRWDGCSHFASLLSNKKEVIPLYLPLDSYNLTRMGGALLIIGPSLEYGDEELKALERFVRMGNTLLIADDFGTGNDILGERGFNLTIRFEKYPFKDIFYYKDPYLPIIVRITDPKLSQGVSFIVLNKPSYLFTDRGDVYSSSISLVRRDFDLRIVMRKVKYGEGEIILISDPSIFINDMIDLNKRFIENLVDYLPSRVVLVDEAHHAGYNLYQTTLVAMKRYLQPDILLGISITFILVSGFYESDLFSWVRDKVFKRKRVSDDTLEETLKRLIERGYDYNTIEKIVSEINLGRELVGLFRGRLSPEQDKGGDLQRSSG